MDAKPANEAWRWTAEEGLAAAIPEGQLSATMFRHGTMRILLYQPKGVDTQAAHEQDEVYVVLRGTGWFVNGERRHPFEPHDVLFVPAGVEHRFEEFSDDFATWVIFYGAKGGEAGQVP